MLYTRIFRFSLDIQDLAGDSTPERPSESMSKSSTQPSTCLAVQGLQGWWRGWCDHCPSGRLQEPRWGTGVGESPDRLCPEQGCMERGPPRQHTRPARNGISCPPRPPSHVKCVTDPLRIHLQALPHPGQAGTPGT